MKLERPVLQAVQPGQNADFAAARRIRPPPVLVNDELIRNELHPVRKFLRHEARNHAVAQREAVRLDGLKPLDRAALFPGDLSRGKGQNHAVEQVAQQLLERLGPVGEAEREPGFVERRGKPLRGVLRGLPGAARPDFPADAAKSVRTLIHCTLDIPVALQNLAAAEAELLDVAGVRRLEQRGKPRRGVARRRTVTIAILRRDDHPPGGNRAARTLPSNTASLVFHVQSPVSDC